MTTAGATSVWRNKDFRLVWTGQALSEFGNGVSQFAYPLLMLAITGSPAAAGALAAVRALPYLLLGLVAGALVDRWDRKRTMITCDLLRALNMVTVPIALLSPRLKRALGLGGLLLSVLWLQSALWVLMAFSTSLVMVGVVLALFTISMPCFGIAALTFQMEVTPDALRGIDKSSEDGERSA